LVPKQYIDGDFPLSRLIKGGWHLAGGHGAVDPTTAKRDMAAFIDAGVTSFDCADIYTGVEQLIGDFREQYPDHARRLRVHTKCVPDLQQLADCNDQVIESIIDRSLQRLRMERLDLVQFHWWDYTVPGYVEAAMALARLQARGKIDRIGVTNFDTEHLTELLNAGVRVVSHQVQYSVLDQRPAAAMTTLCQQHKIALLCYGTVAGGFLSERWLAVPEPVAPLANRSLVKYKLIIDDFGGWSLFQELLHLLNDIAKRQQTDIATIASAAVLARSAVAAVIVGATSTSHLARHVELGAVVLSAADQAALDGVMRRAQGPRGEVYSLERDREGPHGRIMKYNLNTPSA